MDTYKLDETGFFVITSGGDKLDFYEFLSASSFSSADELETKLNVKKRILNYSKSKNFITDIQYEKSNEVLDRISSCLLHDKKNKEIYDKRISKKNKFSLVKSSKKYKTRNVNTKKLKKIIIKIIIGATTLVVAIGCSATAIDNYNSNDSNNVSSYNDEVTSDTYSDADAKYSFRYKVVYEDTISGIAKKFGVSKEDIKREKNQNRSILGEGETVYVITSDKALADAQEAIYKENSIQKSR